MLRTFFCRHLTRKDIFRPQTHGRLWTHNNRLFKCKWTKPSPHYWCRHFHDGGEGHGLRKTDYSNIKCWLLGLHKQAVKTNDVQFGSLTSDGYKPSFYSYYSNHWPQLLHSRCNYFFKKLDNSWSGYTISMSDLHTNKKAMAVTKYRKKSSSAIVDAPALSSQLSDSDVLPESLSSDLGTPFGFLSFLWNSLIS